MRIPNYLKRFCTIVLIAAICFLIRLEVVELINNAYETNNITGIWSEIVGGLTTSFLIFLFYVTLMPIIEISPKILSTDDGYMIKIYNSSIFAAYELEAQFTKVEPIRGNNVKIENIKISLDYIEVVPSMLNISSRRNGNTFAIVHTVIDNENIKDTFSNNSQEYYRLTISCKSGFTGLRKIVTQNYKDIGSLKSGNRFKSGATFADI